MSGPSKVIVLEPDLRAGRQVQLGFEREGFTADVPAVPEDLAALRLPDDASVVMVGGTGDRALELVRRARELLAAVHADIPIVFIGHGTDRAALEAAGAAEVVGRPAFLRDVVIVGRILRDVPLAQRSRVIGNLAETTGVYTLVRALSTLGRSGVLTLIRGLRRGEVRFFQGEVTSAELGINHGQAALHQLLLWTEARFDFTHEEVVRRHQIPLAPEELFADAERFLADVRESAGSLSPASVLEPDVLRVQELGRQIPTEVHGILRLFDGHRVLTDILEDSPYRVFETLRVAQKARDAGLLKLVDSHRPKASWKAVLAVDEWLVGNETRANVVERTAVIETAPISKTKSKSKRRSKKNIAVEPPTSGIDWGELVPRTIGADVGPLSPVVPSQSATGEVRSSRSRGREGLESLTDTETRDKIFPSDLTEPKVVIAADDDDDDTAAWEKITLEAKRRADADDRPTEDATTPTPTVEPSDIDATIPTPRVAVDDEPKSGRRRRKSEGNKTKRGRAATPAKGVRTRTPASGVRVQPPPDAIPEPAVDETEDSDTWARMRADAEAKAQADTNTKASPDVTAKGYASATQELEAKARSDADARTRTTAPDTTAKGYAAATPDLDLNAKANLDAVAKAKADADAKARTDADARTRTTAPDTTAKGYAAATPGLDLNAKANLDAVAKAKADADAKAKADADAKAKADADAKAKADADAKAKADADAKAKADADAKAKADADADAKAKADADAKAKADADAKAKADADAKAKADADADAKAKADADADAKAKADADAKAKADADAKAKADADAKAKADADAKAEAEAKAIADAAVKAATDAAAKAKADADAMAAAPSRPTPIPTPPAGQPHNEQDAKVFAAAALARLAAEGKAKGGGKTEADFKARAEAETKARAKAVAVLARLGAEGARAERARTTPPPNVLDEAARKITGDAPSSAATTATAAAAPTATAAAAPTATAAAAPTATATAAPTATVASTASPTASPTDASARPRSPTGGTMNPTATATAAPTATVASTASPTASPTDASARPRSPTGGTMNPTATAASTASPTTSPTDASARPKSPTGGTLNPSAFSRPSSGTTPPPVPAARSTSSTSPPPVTAAPVRPVTPMSPPLAARPTSSTSPPPVTAAPIRPVPPTSPPPVQAARPSSTTSPPPIADASRARPITGAPLSADGSAREFAKTAGPVLARAEAKVQEAAARSAAAEEARAYAARVKAAAEAKRQEAERKARGSDPTLPAANAADPRGVVRQITTEPGSGKSGGALSAGALVGAAGESAPASAAAPLRPRLLDDTAAFEPVELEKNASVNAEHVIVRESVAELQQVAASIIAPPESSQEPASDLAVTTAFVRADVSTSGTPMETEDEPSDGIIRSTLEGPDPAELARKALLRPPPSAVPEHDGPPEKEKTGEIRPLDRAQPQEPDLDEPSIVIKDQAAIAEVQATQADIGAATAAAMAAAKPPPAAAMTAAPAKPPVDMASASQEAALSGVRRDAVAFTQAEEEFFNKAESHTHSVPRVESFDDLDEGYEPPPSFWERVFGKKKK